MHYASVTVVRVPVDIVKGTVALLAEALLAAWKAGRRLPDVPTISDAQICDSIERNQLRLLRERGADLMLFSPRASAMAHHLGDTAVAAQWAMACNNLIKRVVDLFPNHFAGVCQLPQSPGADLAASIAELERCVRELGFVGCILNPDPSGGHWTSTPLTDRFWYPLFEKIAELDVPADYPAIFGVIIALFLVGAGIAAAAVWCLRAGV